jgi:hypothetical protein
LCCVKRGANLEIYYNSKSFYFFFYGRIENIF